MEGGPQGEKPGWGLHALRQCWGPGGQGDLAAEMEAPTKGLVFSFHLKLSSCAPNSDLLNKLLRKLPEVDRILASRTVQICLLSLT